ncbi:hypothetical protein Hanom_Chr05g00400811 [Helianthus anomalus]
MKCMETCSACTEKDEIIKSKLAELTKTENTLKEKCVELASQEEVHILKQKQINELNREIDLLKSDMKQFKNECGKKDLKIQDLNEHNNFLNYDYKTNETGI